MNILTLFLGSCAAFATPALAQDTAPPSVPKFDWKLRLANGQHWTQTLTLHTHSVEYGLLMPGAKSQKTERDTSQTLISENEVIEAPLDYYLLRVTYTQSKVTTSTKLDDKPQPEFASPSTSPDPVGISFLVKQAPDGRILDVTGLEDFVARQKKSMDELAKKSAGFGSFSPSVASLKRTIMRDAALSPIPRPLAVGESHPHTIVSPFVGALQIAFNSNRTLRSFDAQSAIFDEGGTFAVPPRQVPGPDRKQVLLTGAAAKLYLARKYNAKPASQKTYLSKNGQIYYREANNPSHVIWLIPPSSGLTLSSNEAEPYRNIQGYNGQTSGTPLSEFYSGKAKMPAFIPAPKNALLKIFFTMNGVVTGKSTVDAKTGLTLKSDVSQTITGKTSFVDTGGHKRTHPLLSTSQITSSISMH